MLEKRLLFVLSILNILIVVMGVAGYCKMDTTPPVIQAEGALVYTKETQKSDILAILHAVDKKDGDVSDTLVIEKIIPCKEKNLVWITCGAKDKSNNIVTHTIAVSCDDTYFATVEEKEEIFRLVAGEAENMLETSDTMPDEQMHPDEDSTEIGENVEDEEEETPLEEEAEGEGVAEERAGEPERSEDSPNIEFALGEVKTKKGYNPAWVTVISHLSDDKDTYDTLLGTIKIEGNFDNNTPGNYDVLVYVTDSEGNESVHTPIRIIVEE